MVQKRAKRLRSPKKVIKKQPAVRCAPQNDFAKYHQIEAHLFGEVASRFHRDNRLSAFDFFAIIVWKSNRSKSRVATRLLAKRPKGLQTAVTAITRDIATAIDHRERLRRVRKDWGIGLPIATAILSVLYPKDFTIYDVRVCDSLGRFHGLKAITRFNRLWPQYLQFKQAVIDAVPHEKNLRKKDRYLWGKSFASQLNEDLRDRFGV